ncbi:MAG: BamA/TamA family outer membrane protein, partial [Gammaproteobacteria bacterium]|nr:BamA/TamA family outer membrane protein [Gammaproteobacteria bacterium]
MRIAINNVLFVLLVLVIPASANAVTYVDEIRFEGNEKTRSSILMNEITISPGDELDGNKIQASVQAIMDLGLFRSVDYYLQGKKTTDGSGKELMDLIFVVKEKYYLIVLPRFKTEDNDVHMGLQLRMDNIGGLNHQLRLLALNRGKTSGIREKKVQLKYKDPHVLSSDYQLAVSLMDSNEVRDNLLLEDENVIDQSFNVGVSKFLDLSRGSRGYFVGMGASYRLRQFEGVSSGLLLDETDATSLSLYWGYEDVNRYLYNRGGKEYGYSIEISDHDLGSTSEFVINNFYYRSYYRFESRPDDNLNVQTLFSYATDYVLNAYAFSLGGSDDLRGYDKNRFEGNAQVLLNIEYLTPDDDHKRLRYALFL